MAFKEYVTSIPSSIGLIRINLIDKGTGQSGQEGSFNLEVLDQFGLPLIAGNYRLLSK